MIKEKAMRQQDKKTIITKIMNRHIFKGTSIKQIKINSIVIRIVPMSANVLFSKEGFYDRLSVQRVSDYLVRNNLYDNFITQFGGKNVVNPK